MYNIYNIYDKYKRYSFSRPSKLQITKFIEKLSSNTQSNKTININLI